MTLVIRPGAIHERVDVMLAVRLGDMFRDCAIIDNEALELAAVGKRDPFDAVELAVDSNRQDKSALRNRATMIMRLRSAGFQLLPWPTGALNLIGDTEDICRKCLFSRRIAPAFQIFAGDLLPRLQR